MIRRGNVKYCIISKWSFDTKWRSHCDPEASVIQKMFKYTDKYYDQTIVIIFRTYHFLRVSAVLHCCLWIRWVQVPSCCSFQGTLAQSSARGWLPFFAQNEGTIALLFYFMRCWRVRMRKKNSKRCETPTKNINAGAKRYHTVPENNEATARRRGVS